MTDDPCDLIPRDKHDLERARAAIAAGYPAVAPILPDLFEWLQEMNWPVARVLAPFLATLGRAVLPEVRRILATDDEVWKYWVLNYVVAAMPADVSADLTPELRRMADHPTPGEVLNEVHLAAREILAAQAPGE